MLQEIEFAGQPYQHESRSFSDIGAYEHAGGPALWKLAVEPASEETPKPPRSKSKISFSSSLRPSGVIRISTTS